MRLLCSMGGCDKWTSVRPGYKEPISKRIHFNQTEAALLVPAGRKSPPFFTDSGEGKCKSTAACVSMMAKPRVRARTT